MRLRKPNRQELDEKWQKAGRQRKFWREDDAQNHCWNVVHGFGWNLGHRRTAARPG